MGVPSLKFSKVTVPSTSNFYSTASNFNSTIRVQADFSSGVTTVTNVQDQAGWNGFGKSSIRTGMFLMSSGVKQVPLQELQIGTLVQVQSPLKTQQ